MSVGQKRASNFLGLGLRAVVDSLMWVLGLSLGTLEYTSGSLTGGTVEPSLHPQSLSLSSAVTFQLFRHFRATDHKVEDPQGSNLKQLESSRESNVNRIMF